MKKVNLDEELERALRPYKFSMTLITGSEFQPEDRMDALQVLLKKVGQSLLYAAAQAEADEVQELSWSWTDLEKVIDERFNYLSSGQRSQLLDQLHTEFRNGLAENVRKTVRKAVEARAVSLAYKIGRTSKGGG